MSDHYLITGCTHGLGKALAHECLRQNHHVIGVGRDATAVEDLTSLYPEQFHLIQADLSQPQGIISAGQALRDHSESRNTPPSLSHS